MPDQVYFRPFVPSDKESCLKIFDDNRPSHFAINEREDYEAFLEGAPKGYEVCTLDGDIVGAYGLSGENQNRYQSFSCRIFICHIFINLISKRNSKFMFKYSVSRTWR